MNSQLQKKVRFYLPWLLLVTIVVSLWGSVAKGPVAIEWLALLTGFVGTSADVPAEQSWAIISQIRLPRALVTLIVGFTLGITGACLQGLFRNPLADPSIIGVSAGASLGAGVAIVVAGFLVINGHEFKLLQISLAFLFALATVGLIYWLAAANAQNQGVSVVTMLLAGIAITALVGAVTSLLKFYVDEHQLRQISLWQMGSLQGQSWQNVVLASIFCGITSLCLLRFTAPLNALLLGEEEAQSLGIKVAAVKLQLIILTSLSVAASVAFTGVIGFVGLLAPHCARLLVGPNHRFLLVNSALLGALLLMLSEISSRSLVEPLVVPIGIITALVGAPVFLWLLVRSKGGYRW